jgi:hypothetical protein
MKKALTILLILSALAALMCMAACSEEVNKPFVTSAEASAEASAKANASSKSTSKSTYTGAGFALNEETTDFAGTGISFTYKVTSSDANEAPNVQVTEPTESTEGEEKALLLITAPFQSITALSKKGNKLCISVSSDAPSQTFKVEVKKADIEDITTYTYQEITP